MANNAPQSIRDGRPVEAWATESARRAAGMSREDLAAQMEAFLGEPYGYNQIRRMESGERTIKAHEVAALAAVLEVPEAFLLHGFDPLRDVSFPTGQDLAKTHRRKNTARYVADHVSAAAA